MNKQTIAALVVIYLLPVVSAPAIGLIFGVQPEKMQAIIRVTHPFLWWF